ncbi:MAG: dephospho-CoA kinase [bacterium]
MLKIGLTGSICSGKTTVLSFLKEAGFLTINLDELSKSLLKKNTDEYKKTVDFFGKNILNKDEDINRKILAQIVFSDKIKKKILENIIYPALRKKTKEILDLNCNSKVAVIEGAVIFESGFYLEMDKIILVVCDYSKRLKRAILKFTYEDFVNRNKFQFKQPYKISKSHFIINNSYGLNFLNPQICLLLNFLNNINNTNN